MHRTNAKVRVEVNDIPAGPYHHFTAILRPAKFFPPGHFIFHGIALDFEAKSLIIYHSAISVICPI